MNLLKTCTTCGTALPDDAPSGFCPNCLFEMAVAPGAGTQPTQLDDYELLEELGRGGMGVVHKARQISLNRLVAVKLIKQGLDSSQVLARFEAERQALALMDHPNIARVFEAGRTPEGWPFFVMELVQGVPITRFCDEEKLTIRERLDLFVAVCQAIQHAHQKGIIHRDIKPGNVLVFRQDGRAVPKVIDFGIAKAVGPRLTEETLHTELGAVIGTLEYMSPEQARLDAQDIDTRSDIYALGILLYELLTGTTPLNRKAIKQAAFDEVLRRVREEEPPRPSLRLQLHSDVLADTAARRRSDPARLPRVIQGDVDWIVMKALEKDRSRRYETANGLAQDILRHLRDEPVQAGPPTARYRIGKFVRKHRKAVAAAAGFVTLLVVAVIVSTVLFFRADRERERAVLAERTSTNVLSFFQDNVLAAARPRGEDHGLGYNATIRAAVDAAEPYIARKFTNEPLAEASIRDVLGTTYFHLGENTNALRQHQRSLELWRRHDPQHPRLLSTMNNVAIALQKVRRVPEAIPLLEEVLRVRQARLGPEAPVTLVSMNNLAVGYEDAGRLEDSLRLHQETLRIRKLRQPNHPYTLSSMTSVGASLLAVGRWQEALPLLEEAVELHRQRLPAGHIYTISCLSQLAAARRDAGRIQDALPLYREALELTKAQYPPGHDKILSAERKLMRALKSAGQEQ